MQKEPKGYSAYTYDHLEEGHEASIKHSVYKEAVDISGFVGVPVAELEQMRQASADKEHAIFEKVCSGLDEWEEQAAQTQLIDRALEYARTPPVRHTSNQWQENMYHTRNEISNMVYRMSYSIYEDTKYDRETKESVPVAWYVTWDVDVIGPGQNGYKTQVAGQSRKRYTDKAAMEKYLQGRIKAYEHLFTEISPPIPPEYAQHFVINGQLLPGYTLQGQEPQQSRAAAEISEGGVFASRDREPKASVLGQLAASKAQSKGAQAQEAPKKPREPVI